VISHPQTEPDKQKPDGRKQRYAFLAVCCIPAIVGLVFILYGELKRKQARASLDWPVAAGRIVTSKVTSSTSEGDTTYSADIEYVYTVEGVEHDGDVVVIGGHEYALHSVVARYPRGKTVSVSYDSEKVSRAVLEPGVESYLLHKWGAAIVSGSLFMALLFNFILRRVMHEERNLLDKILVFTFKAIFFPVTICKGNPWVLAIMVAAAVFLGTLELHPVLTIGSAIFAAFYGLVLILILWCSFVGWLESLGDRS